MSIATGRHGGFQSMLKFVGWAALIVFIIGLLVVFGVIDFIF
jgi:hypothetical protein